MTWNKRLKILKCKQYCITMLELYKISGNIGDLKEAERAVDTAWRIYYLE